MEIFQQVPENVRAFIYLTIVIIAALALLCLVGALANWVYGPSAKLPKVDSTNGKRISHITGNILFNHGKVTIHYEDGTSRTISMEIPD